jgi:uncharacterized lipoprotein NlpE involved in copper resistance
MKKIIALFAILFLLLSCNNGEIKNDKSNYTDSINRGVDSGGIKQDPNMNNQNNLNTDSGYKAGGSHTN